MRGCGLGQLSARHPPPGPCVLFQFGDKEGSADDRKSAMSKSLMDSYREAERHCEECFSAYGDVSKAVVRENRNYPGKFYAIIQFNFWTDLDTRERLQARAPCSLAHCPSPPGRKSGV